MKLNSLAQLCALVFCVVCLTGCCCKEEKPKKQCPKEKVVCKKVCHKEMRDGRDRDYDNEK